MENKTALTQLIEEFELLHFKAENFRDKIFILGVLAVIKPYLAIEQKQIEDAYNKGDNNGADRIYYHSDRNDISAEQYYSQTFKSKENDRT